MSCRVPGAEDITAFWANLVDGVESLVFTDPEEHRKAGAPDDEVDDPQFVPVAAMASGLTDFDAGYFHMTPREADVTDPQHRLFLELSASALQDAGYDPARFDGDIGVYGGAGELSYFWNNIARNKRILGLTSKTTIHIGNSTDYLTTLVSYNLGLRGPSVSVHSACSTSGVAIHLACEALRGGECDMALAGAASIEYPIGAGYVSVDGAPESADGHVRPFDARATGTVWASGGGIVVLKRLADAVAARDDIRAVITGNAVNNDGSAKMSFTAPSPEGQANVIRQALALAGAHPRSVGMVEAHGTGTKLGDPIEFAALTQVFAENSGDTGWCALGSVKSNVGHMSQAACVVGIIKAALSLRHKTIPKSLNFEQPNPEIDLANSPFRLAAATAPWPEAQGPRRAGVSSFGFGGTNAHFVLEEAAGVVPPAAGQHAPDRVVLQLSARDDEALRQSSRRLADHLESNPTLPLDGIAHTLRAGRPEMPHRLVVTAGSHDEAVKQLRDEDSGVHGFAEPGLRVAFLYPGQGSQYPGMGAQLYEQTAVFRAAVDECCAVLRGELDADPRDLIFRGSAEALRQTRLAQPLLFTIEYALARLWASWGVRPDMAIGHSIGEYAAAVQAGVFELPDALRLVAARGRLIQALPGGGMVAIRIPEAEALDLIAGLGPGTGDAPVSLGLAAVNSPDSCVVSGTAAAIAGLVDALELKDIPHSRLDTSHAFHSPMMDGILDEFTEMVDAVTRSAPRSPFLSNLSGGWITEQEATSPHYWAAHLRQEVRFSDCLTTVLDGGPAVFVECGPGHTLTSLAHGRGAIGLAPSIERDHDEWASLHAAAGRLWAAGGAVAVPGPATARRVSLPPYPYQRQRHWVEPDKGISDALPDQGSPEPGVTAPSQAAHPATTASADPACTDVGRWFAVPGWRHAPRGPVPQKLAGPWLVLADGALGNQIARRLEPAGDVVHVVHAARDSGPDGQRTGPFVASTAEAVRQLVEGLAQSGRLPRRIVHAWALDAWDDPTSESDLASAQELGFHTLLEICRVVAERGVEGIVIDVLTPRTWDVTGEGVGTPQFATLDGVAAVATNEIAGLNVRRIDVDTRDGVDGILDELRREGTERVVGLRHGRRWTRDIRPVEVPPLDTPWSMVRPGGVYVILGGSGGIGISLAQDLAATAKARIVLAFRSGLPPRSQWHTEPAAPRAERTIRAIERMEQAGAEVIVVEADITSPADLRRVRDAAIDRFGRVDGLVHAAGLPGAGLIEVKDRAIADSVMAPKVTGTLALYKAFSGLSLDFVVLCSSDVSIGGDVGQADYCAANCFQDAFAQWAGDWARTVRSISWGGWQDVGMAAETPDPWVSAPGRAEPFSHPLLDTRHVSASRVRYTGVLSSATHWILDEHRADGRPVLPGVTYLEMARAAFEDGVPRPGAEAVIELSDVYFFQPLSMSDGESVTVQLCLEGTGTERAFEAGRPGSEACVRGRIAWRNQPAPPPVDLRAVRDRCGDLADGFTEDELTDSGWFRVGAHWRSLSGIQQGDGEKLGVFKLPAVVLGELGDMPLHPAVIDEITAFGGGGGHLPLSYGSLVMHRPLAPRMFSYIEYEVGELYDADVLLVDEQGEVAVTIRDFVMAKVDRDRLTSALSGAPVRARPSGRLTTGMKPADAVDAFYRALALDGVSHVIVSATALPALVRRGASEGQELAAGPVGSVPAARSAAAAGPVKDARPLAANGADLFAGPHAFSLLRASKTPRDVETIDIVPLTQVAAAPAAPPPVPAPVPSHSVQVTGLEAAIARIWSDILGVEGIQLDDDFFDLGGNSLVGVKLVAEVRKATGAKLPMRMLFESSTVRGMVSSVENLLSRMERQKA
jgi:acyl transferase domain-containing protein/acyl carrier protein